MRTANDGPEPGGSEAEMAYDIVRSAVEERHAMAAPDEIVRAERDGLAAASVGWETDDGEVMEFLTWHMPDGVVEHELRLITPEGNRNVYIGNSLLRLVNRSDRPVPDSEQAITAAMQNLDDELAALLGDSPEDAPVRPVRLPDSFGVTVGIDEVLRLVNYINDDTAE